jgi:succinate dehydrogenase / fumarate reductase cytochrome b subunit
LFLVLFPALHCAINFVAVFSLEAYDTASEFMGTNPVVQVMEPVLAAGFTVHIVLAFLLSWENRKARAAKNTK